MSKTVLVDIKSADYVTNGLRGAGFINILASVFLRGLSDKQVLLSIMFIPIVDHEKGLFIGVESTNDGQIIMVNRLDTLMDGDTDAYTLGGRIFNDIGVELLAGCNRLIDYDDKLGWNDTDEEIIRRHKLRDELRIFEDGLGSQLD